jgi:hypothetical protein
VNSRDLGSGVRDTRGGNAGLYELASGAEVVAYFDQVMNQQFLPSGRVTYVPMCEYAEGGAVTSIVAGGWHEVKAKKIVDATYSRVVVPSMRRPEYAVEEGVRCVPPNALTSLEELASRYVVVGAGKTGMDAVLWLLDNDVDPDLVTWIMPRDSWLLDRATIQPGNDFFDSTVGGFALRLEAAALATSIDDLFERLESTGQLMRLDPNVRPTMYRCATVSKAELEQLRKLRNVVRMGRVQSISPTEMVLDHGTLPVTPDTLHIDCSADGLARRPAVPVFEGDRITIQNIRTCQPTFSSALIGHVEAAYTDEAEKNEICTPIPYPDSDLDWLTITLADAINTARWNSDAALGAWMRASRLDAYTTVMFDGPPSADQMKVLSNIGQFAPAAIANLPRLIADVKQ